MRSDDRSASGYSASRTKLRLLGDPVATQSQGKLQPLVESSSTEVTFHSVTQFLPTNILARLLHLEDRVGGLGHVLVVVALVISSPLALRCALHLEWLASLSRLAG
jgi:hypothetical protein